MPCLNVAYTLTSHWLGLLLQDGMRLLFVAAKKGHRHVVEQLLSAGAKVDACNGVI
jgi:hypothetical protein